MNKLNFVVIGLLFSSIVAVQSRILRTDSPHQDFKNPASQVNSDDTNHLGLRTTGQITPSEDDSETKIPIKTLKAVSELEGSVSEGTNTLKPTIKPRERDGRSRHHREHRTTTEQVNFLRNEPKNNNPRKPYASVNATEDRVSESTTSQKPTFSPKKTDDISFTTTHLADISPIEPESGETPSENESESKISTKTIKAVSELEGSVSEGTNTLKPTIKPRERDGRSRNHHELRTTTEQVNSLRNEPKNNNSRKPYASVNAMEDKVSQSTTSQKPTFNPKKTDDKTTHLADISPIEPESNVTNKSVQTSAIEFQSKGSFPNGITPPPKKFDVTTEIINKPTETATTAKPWYKRIFS